MGIEEIQGIHQGKVIGILGSGPTLNDYKDQLPNLCDVIIACNGSVMALDPNTTPLDYFLYGDRESPRRAWFKESIRFRNPRGKEVIRILPNFLLPYDEIVLKSDDSRGALESELLDFMRLHPDDEKAYRDFRPRGHVILEKGVNFQYSGSTMAEIDISKAIYCRGSITGMGAQIAWRMGASQVCLFGCGFSNPQGSGTYAYDCKGESGVVTNAHVVHMNEIIGQISSNGVNVVSYGDTKLDVEIIS